MSYQLRTPMVLAPAIFLLSFLAAVGQTDSNKDRTVSGNTSSAYRRGQARAMSRTARVRVSSKLPFEQSVIIYYNGPGKTSASSNPAVVASPTNAVREGDDRKKHPTDTAMSLGAEPAIPLRAPNRADTAVDLQPVIIYYRTYGPGAAVRSSEQRLVDPNVKLLSAASFRRNESAPNPPARTVPKQATQFVAPSNASSFGPTGIEEQRKPTELTRSVRNELPAANLNTNSNETRPRGPEQPLSDPIGNSIPLTDRRISQTQRAVNAPEIEPANPPAEKPAENSVAQGLGMAGARPLQKADNPIQNAANGAAGSNLTPTSPSATMSEASAAAKVVAPGNLSSGSLPAPTSNGLESESSGLVDAVGLNNSAVQLTLDNQYIEAQALLQRAIEVNPTVAKFHRNLSVVFERMKKFDEALASARTAGNLAPTEPSVLEQLCGLELVMGNTTVALGCYEKLKSIRSLDVLSQTYYGIALFQSGKEDESITILEQVAQSTPPFAEAINALGVVYYKKKRFDDAATAFKNAVEVAPDLFEIRYNLAVAQLARRNKAAAISQYNIIKAGDVKLADKLYRILNGDKVLFVTDMKSPRR